MVLLENDKGNLQEGHYQNIQERVPFFMYVLLCLSEQSNLNSYKCLACQRSAVAASVEYVL